MAGKLDSALVFAARAVVDELRIRYGYRTDAGHVIDWAKRAAAKYPEIGAGDPTFWINSAAVDADCLDACRNMLLNKWP